MTPSLINVLDKFDKALAYVKDNNLLCDICKQSFVPPLMDARIILDAYVEEEKSQDIKVKMGNQMVTLELKRRDLTILTNLMRAQAYKCCPEAFGLDEAKFYTIADYIRIYCDDIHRYMK